MAECTLGPIEALFYGFGLLGWFISFFTALIWWKTR
jgi:hypothetical protein